MTRKHFNAIAAAILEARCVHVTKAASDNERAIIREAFEDVAANLANVCAASNPQFSRSRFMAACRGE
jgi:hypothetical protein